MTCTRWLWQARGKRKSKDKEKVENKVKDEAKGLTPYQGSHRSFGLFKCPDCKRQWSSAYSWANTGQDCLKCRIKVYPHHQRPLLKPGKLEVSDANKAHQRSLCEMCKKLRSSCTNKQRIVKTS